MPTKRHARVLLMAFAAVAGALAAALAGSAEPPPVAGTAAGTATSAPPAASGACDRPAFLVLDGRSTQPRELATAARRLARELNTDLLFDVRPVAVLEGAFEQRAIVVLPLACPELADGIEQRRSWQRTLALTADTPERRATLFLADDAHANPSTATVGCTRDAWFVVKGKVSDRARYFAYLGALANSRILDRHGMTRVLVMSRPEIKVREIAGTFGPGEYFEILRFPCLVTLQAFWNSAEYHAMVDVRRGAVDVDVAAFEAPWAETKYAAAGAPRPAFPPTFVTVEGAGGVPLNVVSVGDPAKPGILLIHGLGQSSLSFERQLGSELANDFHLVAFDLRGHGNSGKPWTKAAYQDGALWAEDVQRVIAATGLGKPLLVGWSYGTIVSMDYLRVAGAESVAGLVLVGAYGGLTPPPDMSRAPAGLARARTMQLSPDLADNVAGAYATVPMLTGKPMPPEYVARQVAITLMMPRVAREGMFQRRLDARDLLPALHKLPLLLQVGALDLGMPSKDGEALAKDWPGAKLSVYEGVGHSPFVEAPARFNAELAEFARRVFAAR